jgi:hypothetical protein
MIHRTGITQRSSLGLLSNFSPGPGAPGRRQPAFQSRRI